MGQVLPEYNWIDTDASGSFAIKLDRLFKNATGHFHKFSASSTQDMHIGLINII